MRKFLIVLGVLWVAVLGMADPQPDVAVKDVIRRAYGYSDDGDYLRACFRSAQLLCGADTNRFARLLYEVAQTNNKWVAKGVIEDLGRYGTSAQLPFLYSMTTNAELGATAMRSVLRLEGLTERSVSAASNFLFRTSIGNRPRYEVCECLLECVQNHGLTHPQRGNSLNVAVSFMSSQNVYHDWLDAGLVRSDPSFRSSKRRLRALRAIAERETDPKDLSYVTNAIAELVAYPEADLSE